MMANLDFVAYINAVSSASEIEKKRFLDDFCYGLGYADTAPVVYHDMGQSWTLGETIPNPETKEEFANRAIMEWLQETVRARRRAVAYAQVVIEDLAL